MAKKNIGFFDQHIEKAVVGLCALGMIVVAVFSFSGGRFALDGRGPSDLSKAVADATDQARQGILGAKPPDAKGGKPGLTGQDPMAQLREWFGDSAKGLAQIARVQSPPPRAQPFPPLLPFSAESAKAERRALVKLVTPSTPVVTSGRSTVFISPTKPVLGSGEEPVGPGPVPKGTAISWVSVASQVDLVEQEVNFLSQRYPPRSYLTLVKVHLQRKDADDPSRGWQDVDTYLPYTPMAKPVEPDGRVNLTEFQKWRKNLDFDYDLVGRSPLPQRISGDKVELPPVPYLDEPPKRASEPEAPGPGAEPLEAIASRNAKKWTDWAKAALAGKKPFRQVDLDAALMLARAAAAETGAREKEAQAAKTVLDEVVAKLHKSKKQSAASSLHPPERIMPIMAHDLGAIPGHSYVYRMRYEVVNIYAGNADALIDPADAEKVMIVSAWSPESRPVEVVSDLYFYLTKADTASGKATVTVLKKSLRGVEKQEYAVRAGDRIGEKEKTGRKRDFSTGATCVDVDFNRVVEGKKDVALVYADPADGSLHERLLSRDVQDKNLKKLLEFKPPKQ